MIHSHFHANDDDGGSFAVVSNVYLNTRCQSRGKCALTNCNHKTVVVFGNVFLDTFRKRAGY